MFSPDIICSDEFLEMPPTSRDLYTQLAIRADDDGFVQPKLVMRLLGSAEDDLKILLVKRFILPFESGVVVIKHWLIHNMIRKDRYKPTRFIEEKKLLLTKDNGAYTEAGEDSGNQMTPSRQPNDTQSAPQVRLGKVRSGQDREERGEENPVAVPATLSPAEEMRSFVSEEGKQHEVMALLVSKGIPEALAEREVRKFLAYWTELNKTGKKQRWELQKTFELRRRLATWFNNIAERSQGSQRPRGINLND